MHSRFRAEYVVFARVSSFSWSSFFGIAARSSPYPLMFVSFQVLVGSNSGWF
jgi:hypothetical protein